MLQGNFPSHPPSTTDNPISQNPINFCPHPPMPHTCRNKKNLIFSLLHTQLFPAALLTANSFNFINDVIFFQPFSAATVPCLINITPHYILSHTSFSRCFCLFVSFIHMIIYINDIITMKRWLLIFIKWQVEGGVKWRRLPGSLWEALELGGSNFEGNFCYQREV